MFSSELPIMWEPLEGEEAQTINYVNAIPGAGKTWTFDRKIAKPHVTKKHNSILVYAAPTSKLLAEREKALLDLGINRKRILVITSDSIQSGTVAEAFRSAVVGGKGRKGLANGSIILCTHECIARVPQSMKGRERVVLVYDEARACLQDNYALHLPDEVYKFLTEAREHLKEDGKKIKLRLLSKVSVHETEDEAESVYIWQWSNHRIPMPSLDTIQEFYPKTAKQRERAQSVLDFLKNIHSSSLDVYVSITRKKETNEYVVSNVFSPSRMFKGYAKVLILSAFFESSQMYQFLTSSSLVDGAAVELKDITKRYVDKTRIKSLLERMQRAYLTYVYDLGDKTLTKSDMQQAIVVQNALTPAQRKELNSKWAALYRTRPESYRTVYNGYADQDGRAMRLTDDQRLPAYDLMASIDGKFGVLGGVIPHMVTTAIMLQQAFMQRTKRKPQTLPVGINPRYLSYKESSEVIWDAERLDDFNLRDKQFKVPKNGKIITQLPITAHGLNAYQHLYSCAFLAAMKYSPREYVFMRRALPEYNPSLDRTLDYALQLLWRCNVRLPDDAPVLLIVTDRKLAEALQKRFRKLAKSMLDDELELLPVVQPARLIAGYKSPSILRCAFTSTETQRRSNEARKTSTKGVEEAALKRMWLKTPKGSRYNQLTANMTYARKHGKDFSQMAEERAKLPSFAQWKRTEVGIKAQRSLNKFDKRSSISDALKAIDPNKLGGRDSVLKVLSVIKRECPELKAEAKAWYPGDKFEHNWKTAQDYGKRYGLGFLFSLTGKESK